MRKLAQGNVDAGLRPFDGEAGALGKDHVPDEVSVRIAAFVEATPKMR